MRLGRTLKILRVASGLSQAALAKDLEVTPNYLSLVENDRREPSLTFLKKVAAKLDVPLGYFLWLALNEGDAKEESAFAEKMNTLLMELIRKKSHEENREEVSA